MSGRYPNHEASKRIETAEEHQKALSDLRGPDCDFHHGFNSGLLAASRMFKDHADISHLELHEVIIDLRVWGVSVYLHVP